MELKFITSSPEETKKIGKRLSGFLSPGDVVFFLGELGGGKTTFISGIAEGLKVKENVSSPSFTLINIYNFIRDGVELRLVHCDLYRINSFKDIPDIGIEEYLYDSKSVTLIEWGSFIKEKTLKEYLEIRLEYFFEDDFQGENFNTVNQKRKITFSESGVYWEGKIEIMRNTLII